MSLASQQLKQCCEAEPVWIFTYSDGSVFAICNNHVKNPAYHIGLEKIFKISTQEEFSLEQIIGGTNFD